MSTFELLVNDYKKRLLTEALTRNRWNQCRAARDLGIHRNTLERYMDNLDIVNPKRLANLRIRAHAVASRIGAINHGAA